MSEESRLKEMMYNENLIKSGKQLTVILSMILPIIIGIIFTFKFNDPNIYWLSFSIFIWAMWLIYLNDRGEI